MQLALPGDLSPIESVQIAIYMLDRILTGLKNPLDSDLLWHMTVYWQAK